MLAATGKFTESSTGDTPMIDTHEALKLETAKRLQVDLQVAPGEELPSIQTNSRRHRDVSQDAYNAMLSANIPPTVFVRSGLLTRITEDENGRPIVSTMSESDLKHTLERAANFFTRRRTADGVIDTSGGVPIVIVKDVMSYPSHPALPPLVGVVTAPVFSPNGELVTEPGYNRAAKVFYYRDGVGIGDTAPTAENVKRAKSLIFDDLLVDFKFVDNASKANAVSLILLPFVRPLIPGSCPMYLVDAPTFGTGKSLLIKACAQPFTDHVALMTAPADQEEWRKRITSTLMTGPSHILIDNLKETLDSSHLAAVLTTNEWSDRVLGMSLTINLPARSIWTATGNNVAVSNELARRLCWIRLDSEVEKPWERTVFKHPNLIQWATNNRSALATAALTLIRKWVSEGMVKSSYRLGSFESWSQIMGGILEAIEIPGFMDNALEMYDRLAADDAPIHSFVKAWWERHGKEFVTVSELFPIASAYDTGDTYSLNILGDLLQQKTEHGRKTALGALLRKHEGRIFSGYKIRQGALLNNAVRYRLEDTGMR